MKLAETNVIPSAVYFKIHSCSQRNVSSVYQGIYTVYQVYKGISSLPAILISFTPEHCLTDAPTENAELGATLGLTLGSMGLSQPRSRAVKSFTCSFLDLSPALVS